MLIRNRKKWNFLPSLTAMSTLGQILQMAKFVGVFVLCFSLRIIILEFTLAKLDIDQILEKFS